MRTKLWLTRDGNGDYNLWLTKEMPHYDKDLSWWEHSRAMARDFPEPKFIVMLRPDLILPCGREGACELIQKKGRIERK